MMALHFVWFLLQGEAGAGLLSLLPFVLIFVLFYFLIILPQRKRQKQIQQMLDNLKVGDKVITSGGIYGTITMVREDKRTLQLRIAENPSVKIDVARSAIAGLQEAPEEKS